MSKWISVEDRLPEAVDWYLIVYKMGYVPKVTMAFYDGKVGDIGGLWLCHNDKEDGDEWENVSHWMPLPPEPPKDLA